MRSLLIFAAALITAGFAHAEPIVESMNPKTSVIFVSPKDGAKVSSPVKVKMNVIGMKLRPADQDPKDKTSGHHHLIIDGGPIPKGQVVPKDETHLHFGQGQTETEVKLTPGSHTLTLQFADGSHISYGPGLSQTIHILVK